VVTWLILRGVGVSGKKSMKRHLGGYIPLSSPGFDVCDRAENDHPLTEFP
jgi:hypothetical protein